MQSSLASWVVCGQLLEKWTEVAQRAIKHGDKLRIVFMDGQTDEAEILDAYDSGHEHIVACRIHRGAEPTIMQMRLQMAERALVGIAYIVGPDGLRQQMPALAKSIVRH